MSNFQGILFTYSPVQGEKRIRGPGRGSLGAKSQKTSPKSLEKVSRAGGPKSPKKVSKKVRKVKRTLNMGFWRLFRPLNSRLFSDFWDPRPGRLYFSGLLVTFWLFAPRLPLPGPRNLNPWGKKDFFEKLDILYFSCPEAPQPRKTTKAYRRCFKLSLVSVGLPQTRPF